MDISVQFTVTTFLHDQMYKHVLETFPSGIKGTTILSEAEHWEEWWRGGGGSSGGSICFDTFD